MQIINMLKVLNKMDLLSPLYLKYFVASVHKHGINLMMLADFAGKAYGERTALMDDEETISYKELADQSEQLAVMLKEQYQLRDGQKIGILCKNHCSLVRLVFAASRLGLDVYMLNSEMKEWQFGNLVKMHKFDFLVYDEEMAPVVAESSYTSRQMVSIPSASHAEWVNPDRKLKRTSLSKIILLTGGTTGESKIVKHKPSLFNYLHPFTALLTKLRLVECQTVYIATPIYHGYGIAVLLSFIALGKKVLIRRSFDAEKACKLVTDHQVEAITVVPLMIQKMLDANADGMKSLKCIASGGAELNPGLIDKTCHVLGDVLYNLYGTSEAGLNIIATPEDLQHSRKTLGRTIEGVDVRVLDRQGQQVAEGEVGQFCIKNKWSMKNRAVTWIETKDLGYRDADGYYFFCSRMDDMIVSGGENVYPIELERLLLTHPNVKDAAVIGITDATFGQRLKAFVQPAEADLLSEEVLAEWLKKNAARFHIPKEMIIVDSLPYTSLGKLDKKQLS